MTMIKLNSKYALLLVVLGLAVLVGCSNTALYKAQGTPATAQVNFCTTPSTSVVTNLKFLFVTDTSGSNQQNYLMDGPGQTPYPDPAGGTDPDGSRRYSGLLSFLQNPPPGNNIYYASLFFNTNPIIPFSNFTGGGGTEGTSDSIWYTGGVPNTAAYMATQYQNVWCTGGNVPPNCIAAPPYNNIPQGDGGWTDYIDTLTTVYNSIVQDIQYEQSLVAAGQPLQASNYVIFWTSDGYPWEAAGPQNVGTILQLVQNIMNLKASQQYGQYVASITFNTAFYWTSSTGNPGAYEYGQAQSLMSEMASIGLGDFITIQTGQNIDYSLFAVPTQNPPFVLRDIWIHDASAAWWNGQLMLDSDNDGIPDTIETQLGSNPNKYDSDQNGVGDGVENYLWGKPCNAGNCSVAGANKSFVGTIAGCSNPGAYPNVYPDTDLDYLNDCEEGLLGSNNVDFDSNQDWVPDQLEWLYNVSFLYGTNSLTADPAGDGVDDYQKMKYLFPINVPFSQVHVPQLNYSITQTSSNNIQSCYSVDVNSIATMSSSDVIRVYIMESEGAEGASLRHMRVLKNITRMNGTSITINDGELTP